MDEIEKIHKKFYNNHMVDDKHCKCQICGYVLYKGMLGIHLKKVHTLSQEEYYLKITGINMPLQNVKILNVIIVEFS